MADPRDYMSVEQICMEYEISDSTVRRRVVRGLPKYRIIGKATVYYKRTDVEPRMVIKPTEEINENV